MHTHLDVSLPAVPVSVRQARDTVGEVAASLGASKRLVEDLRLCVSEAAANVVRHAYSREEGVLSLTLERSGDELTVVVRDEGVGLIGFQREGDLGYGLRIIEQLTLRCAITSVPNAGTEVRMVFALERTD
jgi:anti-sigma regulatory factor (Ser/Thr protein kinase)